jgi:hypothetical protein
MGSRRRDIRAPPGRNDTAKIVCQLRKRIGLQATFALVACRHGGMTEL